MSTAPLIEIHDPLLKEKSVQLWLKREDLLHPAISGNKWRKLKYNIQQAEVERRDALLTFGGAYSNHIAATAAAGKKYGLRTIGIIRGEEYLPLNPTLHFATSCGMQLHYVSREEYRRKNDPLFLESISQQFGYPYVIPEGGTNFLAVKGCTEIVDDIALDYDYICCAAGIGGTLAGIIAGLAGEKQVLGFPALKGGEFLYQDVDKLVYQYSGKHFSNWKLITDYHFGGYAKVKPPLINFIKSFQEQHLIPLEPIYTGKMLFGLFDLINKNHFAAGTRIVAIHTGGLQGNAGFAERLGLEL